MNKPISIVINDVKNSMVAICNNSHLPSCVLELIVKDILNEIHVLSQKQLQEDELAYMNSLAEAESTEREQTEQQNNKTRKEPS